MARVRQRLSSHYLALIIVGLSGAAAGFPLFYVARAWSAPMLLLVPFVAIVLMVLGFAVAPTEPRVPRDPAPGEGEIANLSEVEFEALLDDVEASARQPAPEPVPGVAPDPFDQLVRDALDDLPAFVQNDLRSGNLVVIPSNGGDEWNALGLYMGGDVADDRWHRRILIFRDTLTRAYGHDPEELRRQIAITVRHEVAHFYGADEQKASELGL